MALFGRRKNETQAIPGGIPRDYPGASGQGPGDFPGQPFGASLLGQAAFTQGWQPVGDRPFDGHLEGRVAAIISCLWGMSRGVPRQQDENRGTNFRDAFRSSVDGRTVTVANAWSYLLPPGIRRDPGFGGAGCCAVELPSTLPILCVQPRRIHAVLGMHATPVGSPEFDRRFIVNAVPAGVLGDPRQVLTPEVQQRIMARDDWVFLAERYLLGCFSRGPFGSFEEATQRLSEVLAIVAAIPASVLPSRVDHSQDDLIDRISRLTSIEDALAFLQGLTPGERERLAQSGTPLAAFADCQTPEEAMARFQTLDQGQRLQIITMFTEVRDARRNP
jgi:hypothetical protein